MTRTVFASGLTAVLMAALSGQALAGGLGDINAVSCGTDPAKASRIAKPTGAVYEIGNPAILAAGADSQFPAMVKLKMIYQHDGYAEIEHCGGTVIDSRHVITAAHCVKAKDGLQWDRIELVTGDHEVDSSRVIRRTAHQAVCHAGADTYLSNDIAIVKLDQPLPKEIVPAQIDDFRRPTVKPGGIALAAGWPVTGPKAGQTSLQKVPLSVTDVEWPGFITVTSPFGRMEGVCQGESGGPLLSTTNGYQSVAGVLSGIEPGTNDHTGEPCMKAGYDMYYTPIAAYRDWIENVIDMCSNHPDECRGKDESSFFMSSGPAGQGVGRMASVSRYGN
mgnify:CR=1 FL=1